MAVLKNRTKRENFLVVSKIFLQDANLSLAERGLLATMHSLPDDWDFTIKGMCRVLPDGEARISNALKGLRNKGYVSREQSKGDGGKFGKNVIEIFERPLGENPVAENPITEKLVPEKPSTGKPLPENHGQYNNKEYSTKEYSKNQSINQSAGAMDEELGTDYRSMISDNIKLDWLLETAAAHGDSEVKMVNEIYEVICDMVCVPRRKVEIKGAVYPWQAVKSQFLKLRYQHIADILNRIVDADLGIKNMSAYLISTLYTQSLVGTLEMEASQHDDYLKYLRGKPY